MKIAKEFRWEMGHRLPFHKGKCVNLHGHSYKMLIELEGDLDANGMLIDYYDLKRIVHPIIEEMDHAFMAHVDDTEVVNFLSSLNSKKVVVDFHSTAENISIYLAEKLKQSELKNYSKKFKVRVYETPDDYAETGIEI